MENAHRNVAENLKKRQHGKSRNEGMIIVYGS
jgi:hypothetical protein